MNNNENNKVKIIGEIIDDFAFSHEMYGEKFYTLNVRVNRTSDACDIIPIMFSERMIDVSSDYTGKFVCISGHFRSFNRREEDKSRLLLHVFVNEIEFLEECVIYNENSIELEGYICKDTVYRYTPLGKEIADVLLAVNRPYGKCDYIPCICWGRNARFANNFEVGTKIWINGRIQSRNYIKKFKDGNTEERTAYEVSISKMGIVDDQED